MRCESVPIKMPTPSHSQCTSSFYVILSIQYLSSIKWIHWTSCMGSLLPLFLTFKINICQQMFFGCNYVYELTLFIWCFKFGSMKSRKLFRLSGGIDDLLDCFFYFSTLADSSSIGKMKPSFQIWKRQNEKLGNLKIVHTEFQFWIMQLES